MRAMFSSANPGSTVGLSFPTGVPLVYGTGAVTFHDGSGLSAHIDGPEAALSSAWFGSVSVSLEALGRDSKLLPTPNVTSRTTDGHVAWNSYDTDGFLLNEYWRVDQEIEHGYFVSDRPDGNGDLVFDLVVDGARAEQDGVSVTLASDTESRLNWGQLAVWDATGTALPDVMGRSSFLVESVS